MKCELGYRGVKKGRGGMDGEEGEGEEREGLLNSSRIIVFVVVGGWVVVKVRVDMVGMVFFIFVIC